IIILPTPGEQELTGLKIHLVRLDGRTPVHGTHYNLFDFLIIRGAIPLYPAHWPRAAMDSLRGWRLFGLFDSCHWGHKHLLVGFAVNAVKMTILTPERHHGLARIIPVQHRRRPEIEIKPIVRRHLMPPLQCAGARVEHHHAIGKEICSWAMTRYEIGRRIANRDE